MKKKPKIEWASSVAVDALEPYVREILQVVADVTEQPGVASAWISDESWISDFLPVSCYGDGSNFQERADKQDDPERAAAWEKLAEEAANGPSREEVELKLKTALKDQLGIEIDKIGTPVYEVAIKLRDL